MIKAFGMCGDMRMAFELMDEMQEEGHVIDGVTYSQIMIACISDKQAGLKHIIEVSIYGDRIVLYQLLFKCNLSV